MLHDLADLALTEDWSYPDAPDPYTPFPILRSYLNYTFYKQYVDKQIVEVFDGQKNWAAFNTGLVDDRYDPIFALYEQNSRPSPAPRWKFYAFCPPNFGKAGGILARNFNPLPPPPKYFQRASEVVFDPDKDIHPNYEHIIYDGIANDKYPWEFLQGHVPSGIIATDPSTLSKSDREAYLMRFTQALQADTQADRNICRRISDAIDLAKKRVRLDYRTAVPSYYPLTNKISLLLPLALVHDDTVDLALVVAWDSGGYIGRTVYKLGWAYAHARLVYRQGNDWLKPTASHRTEDDDLSQEASVQDDIADSPVGTAGAAPEEMSTDPSPFRTTAAATAQAVSREPANTDNPRIASFRRRS